MLASPSKQEPRRKEVENMDEQVLKDWEYVLRCLIEHNKLSHKDIDAMIDGTYNPELEDVPF